MYWFTKHLDDNNQTYFEHIRDSWSYSFRSLKSSIYFFFHGLMPFTFEHAGGDEINELFADIINKRSH